VIIGVDMEEINKVNRNGLLLYLQLMGGNNVCINSHAKHRGTGITLLLEVDNCTMPQVVK
jgi:hypothetical protein